VAGSNYLLVKAASLLKLVGNWEAFLAVGVSDDEVKHLRCHERTGRSMEGGPFTAAVERRLRRPLPRGTPEPKGSRVS